MNNYTETLQSLESKNLEIIEDLTPKGKIILVYGAPNMSFSFDLNDKLIDRGTWVS